MEVFKKHIELLGKNAEDKITGFKGIVDSIAFDLYGCIQVSLKPPLNDKGEMTDGYWFDVTRLKISNTQRIVELPNFTKGYIAEGKKGACDKPTKYA